MSTPDPFAGYESERTVIKPKPRGGGGSGGAMPTPTAFGGAEAPPEQGE